MRHMHFFGIAHRAQARAYLSTGPCLTVVSLTFSVLVQGRGRVAEQLDRVMVFSNGIELWYSISVRYCTVLRPDRSE